MAKLSHSDSRRMYSWWWDSHISPKNSKWLQENLTDMDSKVKVMIKLIEEDADSFARRAEMYYKKRPELMKLVEDFYRAYRALAERYDHATGVIRHAHRTMSEAFPNQLPLMFADDSPANSGMGMPEMSTPNGEFTDDHDSVARKKVLKQVNERVRKGINFDETEEKERSMPTNHIEDRKLSKTDNGRESKDVLVLKEALTKLEAEKEAGLAQYQQSLDRISKLEAEISRTNEEFRVLRDHATKAETEVVILKESLSKLETEKEYKLQEYQQSLERICDLQKSLSTSQEDAKRIDERASRAETEAESLKGELHKLTVEKDEALSKYMESLQLISNLENKLLLTEEDARRLKVRAENAESEVEILKQTISKLNEEKDVSALQYQQCLETISSLEQKLASAEKEAERLNLEIDCETSKLKGAEEQCSLLQKTNQSLHSELELLMLKMGTQTQELTEKQKEVGKLWACVQEERLRFVEAETAFQTLQHLHAQTQEELQSMASELQKRAQLMNVLETHNQSLQDEVLKVKEENRQLDEVNTSSALSIKDMQNEIFGLKESKGALEVEAELRLDQRNALQQEIYCLKEELNDLNKKHNSVLDQVRAVGLNSEFFGSSVKELQDENSKLKETCQRESSEKAALLAKLEILEQLLEKNSILESTLSDLNAELEAVRGKIETLEHSCQSLLKEKTTLLDEKATLMIQMQETTENLERLSEKNNVLENSLSDANRQFEALKEKSKGLEDSCQLLVNEKAGLISEKDGLTSELETTRIRLEDLGKIYGELEGRCITLEKEKESTLQRVEELQISLDVERQERASYIQMSEMRFTGAEAEIHLLREESERRKVELDQVIDSVVNSEIEIFVLRRTAQDLAQVNWSIVIEKQKLLEEYILSEKKISHLEKNNYEQESQIKSLSDQADRLSVGTRQLFKVLDIVEDHTCKGKREKDKVYFNQMLCKLHDLKESLNNADEENLQRTVQLSIFLTWIKQLEQDLQNLKVEKGNIENEHKVKTEQLLALQSEVLTVLNMNEELRSKLREEYCNKEALMLQIEDLNRKLKDMQREKFEISEEKRSLMDNFILLDEKNNVLEEENYVLYGKVLALDNHSLIFRSFAEEKFMGLKTLGDDFNKLHNMNAALMGKLSLTERKLEESKSENLHLQERLRKSENELKDVTTIKDQLSDVVENGKKVLHLMELELHEAARKMNLVETEKLELDKSVEGLKTEYTEVKMVRDSQEKQILKLSEENNRLRGVSQSLEVELHELHGENNKRKIQEEKSQFELQRKINEINRLEIEAASVVGEFQFSMVSQLLYEQKYRELHEACLGYIYQNGDLKSQLAAYAPEVVALKECISSLENHAIVHIKFQNPENEEIQQGTQITNDPHPNEDKKEPTASTFLDLRDLRTRLQAIEKAAVETKELMVQENVNLRCKLDAATRQLDSLSENGRSRRNLKPQSEITEADGALLTKDIMLDQVSDSSSRGLSTREPIDTDSQIVELSETIDPASTVGLTVSKSKKLPRVRSVKKQKSEFPTSEKELSIDKLEISKRFNGGVVHEGSKRKVLERLNSDVQKLANLQIMVQDLKRKLGVVEKDKRGKAVIECEALKGQLEEANMTIMKLFDVSGKLTKNVENNSPFPEVWSSFDLEGDGSTTTRRRVSGQAARMSEKIGRLQLEIQKLQFILLKLDGEKEGKTEVSETRRRILLRDYLYGGRRKGQTRKKTHFCACVQPSTVEE